MQTYTVSAAELEALRFWLIVGGLLLLVWWIAQLRAERPDVPAPQPASYCKLHQRPEHLCQDMHDSEDA